MKLKIHDDYTIHFPINKLCGNKISQNAGNLIKKSASWKFKPSSTTKYETKRIS